MKTLKKLNERTLWIAYAFAFVTLVIVLTSCGLIDYTK
jgi:hypothetical protein